MCKKLFSDFVSDMRRWKIFSTVVLCLVVLCSIPVCLLLYDLAVFQDAEFLLGHASYVRDLYAVALFICVAVAAGLCVGGYALWYVLKILIRRMNK